MKAILQLLKEFLVPLAIGIAWTSYNVFQMPRENWKVATFINLFAPTFFFASWLVAQWYRVRKQQRIEDSLAGIGARIDGSSFPVLLNSALACLTVDIMSGRVDSKFVTTNSISALVMGLSAPGNGRLSVSSLWRRRICSRLSSSGFARSNSSSFSSTDMFCLTLN